MLGSLLKIGKTVGEKMLKKDGKPSGTKITAVVVAGAGLIGAVLVSSGLSPELAQAIEEFVKAIGLLAVDVPVE